jgi:hypothetical protein
VVYIYTVYILCVCICVCVCVMCLNIQCGDQQQHPQAHTGRPRLRPTSHETHTHPQTYNSQNSYIHDLHTHTPDNHSTQYGRDCVQQIMATCIGHANAHAAVAAAATPKKKGEEEEEEVGEWLCPSV